MKSLDELRAEHRTHNENYVGSPVAPLPSYPERDGDLKPWSFWEKQQRRNCRRWLGGEYFDELEGK